MSGDAFYYSDWYGCDIAIDNTLRYTPRGEGRRRPIRHYPTQEERLEQEIRREEESDAS